MSEALTTAGGRRYEDFDPRTPFLSYFRVTRDVVAEPERFFRAVRGGGYGGPTLFVLVTHLLVGLLAALVFVPFVLLAGLPMVAQEDGDAGMAGFFLLFGLVGVVALVVVFPIFGVIFTFVAALFWHPFVALLVGVGRGAGYRETYRVAAYSAVIFQAGGSVGSAVPVIGPLLFLAFGLYVSVMGVKGAHETTTARAVVSVVVPLVLAFILLIALFAGLLFFLESQGVFDPALPGPPPGPRV